MNVIAVDVSKAKLDVYFDQVDSFEQFENSPDGFRKLVRYISAFEKPLVVLEATGGYEKALVIYLAVNLVEISICSGRRVREFARSQGVAKTDKLDAKMIAKYAKSTELNLYKLPDQEFLELRDLNTRREQLLKSLNIETNRLDRLNNLPTYAAKHSINKIISLIKKEIEIIEQKIDDLIIDHQTTRERIDLLTSMPGIGKQTALVMLCELPELGQTSKNKISALTGLAPFNKDSGTMEGSRKISKSRGKIKAVLYMACMSAIQNNRKISEFYFRLKEKGKSARLAIIACMRKMIIYLNAMMAKQER